MYLCDTRTGKLRGKLPTADRFNLRAFSPDGKLLATQTPGKGREFHIHLWDISALKKRQTLKTPPNIELSKAAFSWDGRRLAGIARRHGGGLGDIRFDLFVWEVASGKLISQQEDLRHLNEDTLTFSPDGQTLAVGSRDEVGVSLLDAATLKRKGAVKAAGESLLCWTLPPWFIRRMTAVGGVLLRLPVPLAALGRRTPLGSGRSEKKHDGCRRYGSRLVFSPNGETLACQEGAEIRLYDAASGRPLTSSARTPPSGLVLAVSPNGKIVVSGDSYGVVRLWDAATSKQLWMREGDGREVASCLFSADGKRLVSVSKADPSLLGGMAGVFFNETAGFQVWDVATGKALQRIKLRTLKRMVFCCTRSEYFRRWQTAGGVSWFAGWTISPPRGQSPPLG